jgi:hypothetical protein
VGIFDTDKYSASEIVANARAQYIQDYEKINGIKYDKDYFSTDTWFKYVKDRRPLLMIYPIDLVVDPTQEKQITALKADLGDVPMFAFLMGFPQNEDAATQSPTKYKANKIYNWFDRDDYDIGDQE